MNILLAVSGGVDSMYLANRASDLFPGARFAVAHCNFSLRGDESDGDESFVREWCRSNGVECFVKRFDTSGYAEANHVSIEMAARDLRYAWFSELCMAHGFQALCTAHNANDNAETLVLNLLRGTGIRGMRGIAATSTLKREAGEVEILRPLIGIPRSEIEAWMKENGKRWREDSTNRESTVKRNVVRNEVFPVFARINPSYLQTLNSDIKRFAQVDDIAEDYYLSARKEVCDDEGIVIDKLLGYKHWKYLLFRLTEDCGLCQDTFEKLVSLMERFKSLPRGTVTLGGKTFEGSDMELRAVRGHLTAIEK